MKAIANSGQKNPQTGVLFFVQFPKARSGVLMLIALSKILKSWKKCRIRRKNMALINVCTETRKILEISENPRILPLG
jgi:hypothetical protein